ncbi:MAG: radical SAM protein [Candidatus Lokiarchaeia archaeon]
MPDFIPIKAKSIILKRNYADGWFLEKYAMNIYRGCQHACEYCDGRSERYHFDLNIGSKIYVKANAPSLVRKQLRNKEKGIVAVGGGIGDSYQPIEKKYELTRRVLEVLLQLKFPVYILTKSSLVERDLDLLKEINEQSLALVTFTITSLDDDVWKTWEPRASPPEERFKAMGKFSRAGIPTGLVLIPILPFIADNDESIEKLISRAKEEGAGFTLAGGLTLRDRQKKYYYEKLKEKSPELIPKYNQICNETGYHPNQEYTEKINSIILKICREYEMPLRTPHKLFHGKIPINDEISHVLSQIGYLRDLVGKRGSPYRKAANQIFKTTHDITKLAKEGKITEIRGVGEKIGKLVEEIIETGKSEYYLKLMEV